MEEKTILPLSHDSLWDYVRVYVLNQTEMVHAREELRFKYLYKRRKYAQKQLKIQKYCFVKYIITPPLWMKLPSWVSDDDDVPWTKSFPVPTTGAWSRILSFVFL